MNQEELYKILKDKSIYGPDIDSIKVLQTHISFVVLTGEFAYKIKKAVDFGFLNFSTLEKRKYFCEEELRLNKRLCKDIYLEVLPITEKNGKIRINGQGKVIDYTLKMKEFPQDKIMSKLIKEDKVDENIIDRIVDILIDFYKKSKRNDEIDNFGNLDIIKNNTDENFQQTQEFIDLTIPKKYFDFIKDSTNKFLREKNKLFKNRVKDGYIRDCHGDLHSGNIVVDENKIYIFDCIEFNKRFRYSDLASDLAFLSMDLDYLGHPYLSSYLINKYVEKSKDTEIYKIINFYKSYRAYVRGKVIGFKLNDPNINKKEKNDIINTAKRYFELSYYYSLLFSKDIEKDSKRILFITTGLTGTGKTTVAKKLSIDYNAEIVSTDSVRKEIEGMDRFERHYDAYNTGLYSPEKMRYAYDKVLEKGNFYLKKNRNVVLDATFKNNELRKKAYEITKNSNSKFIIIYCNVPEEIVKKYLNNRLNKKTVSDGRWEIYEKQKHSFEKIKDDFKFVDIDISKKDFDYQIKKFFEINNKICEVKT